MSRTERPLVLLADDNDATCALVTAILQRDFAVELAADGNAALELLRTRSYAAVLLDLRMPHLDGFGVLEQLQETSPELIGKVVLLTASVTRAEIDRTRRYPVAGIVTKPFEVEALVAAVKKCAGSTGGSIGNVLSSGMILLIADLIRQRWM